MLKPRHVDVLDYAAAGYSVAETAEKLGLAISTVSHLRGEAICEMGSLTITGAVVTALARGILSLDDYTDS